MGYESSLHLINVKIKPESRRLVLRALGPQKGREPNSFGLFLERAVIDMDGCLAFTASEDGLDPYVPDESDGTVPALYGKWYEAERIAHWLKWHSEKGGRLVLHSTEADGEAWGWEFDGKGRMRPLGLTSVGKWE